MTIRITLSDADLLRAFETLRGSGVDPRPALLLYGGYMKQIAAKSIQRQKSPVTGLAFPGLGPMVKRLRGGGKRLYDTGRLVRTWAAAPIRVSRGRVSVPNSYPPAKLHQFGGTVKPRQSKYLALPLTKEAKKAGRARRWWDLMEKQGNSPFVFTSKKGNLCIGVTSKMAKGAKSVPGKMETHWLLLDSVAIPATPYVGFGEPQKKVFMGMLANYLAAQLRKVAR